MLSILSFYYIHLQGPKFRIEHLSVEIPELGNSETVFRHTIAIINNGNKTGILRNLIVETDSDTEFSPSYLKVSRGGRYVRTTATMAIKPKDSVIIMYDYLVKERVGSIPHHWIKTIIDESIGLDIDKSEKVIWRYDRNQRITTPENSSVTHPFIDLRSMIP